MNRKLLVAAGAAVGLFIGYAAQAAPATNALEALKVLGAEQSQVDQVRCWRRCRRVGGGMRCRRVCRKIGRRQ